MNRLQVILFSMMFCLSSFMVSADEPIQSLPSKGNVTLLWPTGSINRPNSQGQQYTIVCYYGTGYMVFELPSGVELLTISIKDANFTVWQGDVTVDEPYTEIPTYLSGEYTVECITDMNEVFEGTIEL